MAATRFLDTEAVVNNFRLQPYIEDEIAKADVLRKSVNNAITLAGASLNRLNDLAVLDKVDLKEFDSQLLLDLALTYVEVGDWNFVNACIYLIERIEKANATQNPKIAPFILYIKGIASRENNQCQVAIEYFNSVISFTPQFTLNSWLIANTYRNLGLAHLKNGDQSKDDVFKNEELQKALNAFDIGCKFLESKIESEPKLAGSLPAMRNYRALLSCKIKIIKGEYPAEGLAEFAEVTRQYKESFAKMIGDKMGLEKSHDWQSHNLHQAMVHRQIVSQKLCRSQDEKTESLKRAMELTQEAIQGRIANKADGQRVGDAYFTLGEIHESFVELGSSAELYMCVAEARAAYTSAKWHFLGALGLHAQQTEKANAKLKALESQLSAAEGCRNLLSSPATSIASVASTSSQQNTRKFN